MGEMIPAKLQEQATGAKSVEVMADGEGRFRFDLSVFPHAPDEALYLHHLERLLHTAPSDKDILYPPPDIADMRELLENQSVDVDTMIVSPDDIAGDLIRLLPEVKQNHNIEGRAAILIIEGDIGLLEIEATAEALESECKTDVLQVGFYKGDIPFLFVLLLIL